MGGNGRVVRTLPTSSSLRGFQQGVRLFLRSGVELDDPGAVHAVRTHALRSVGVHADEPDELPGGVQSFDLAPAGALQEAVPVVRAQVLQRRTGVVPVEHVLDQDDHALLELVTTEDDALGGGVEQVVDGDDLCGNLHGILPC